MSDDLSARMKAAGMLPLEEMLAGNVMGRFSTHVGVTDFESLLAWAERKHEQYLRMRMAYELGDQPKSDDLYEWVFAHSAVFAEVVDHLRKIKPSKSEATE
jgi:hypothetical protein